MKVALAQISPVLSRHNEALHVKHVRACEDACDVLVFPELSLNGYTLKDAVFVRVNAEEALIR
jgi:predicted amidohydrolase